MRIERAAILHDGVIYSVPAPGRHHDVCRLMADEHGFGPETMREQGFLTDDGEYVMRKAACIIAEKAGQIGVVRPKTFPLDTLFSEDVW